MDEIAGVLFGAGQPLLPGAAVHPELMQFRAMSLQAQQQMLAQSLRSERHVLILDNLESVTGENLAVQNTLTAGERDALRSFLCDLSDGYNFLSQDRRRNKIRLFSYTAPEAAVPETGIGFRVLAEDFAGSTAESGPVLTLIVFHRPRVSSSAKCMIIIVGDKKCDSWKEKEPPLQLLF